MTMKRKNEIINIQHSVGGYFPSYFAETEWDEEGYPIDFWVEKLSFGSFATRQEAIDNLNLNYPIDDKDCDYYGVIRKLRKEK